MTKTCANTCLGSNMNYSSCAVLLALAVSFLIIHVDSQDSSTDFLLVADKGGSTIYMGGLQDFDFKPLPLGNVTAPVAVDYDPINGMIYWTDYMDTVIIRAHLNGSRRQILVQTDLVDPAGLSLDYMAGLMFWTDGKPRRKVERATMDGADRRVIVSQRSLSPRAIATDWKARYVYWTRFGDHRGAIERVDYDGNHHVVLVEESITWPNGMALDLKGGWLYWCDANYKTIERINLQGNNATREVIMTRDARLHPFGLALYADTLLWTDWNVDSLLQWNMTHGRPELAPAGPNIFQLGTGIHLHSTQSQSNMYHYTEALTSPVPTMQSELSFIADEQERMDASGDFIPPRSSAGSTHTRSIYVAIGLQLVLVNFTWGMSGRYASSNSFTVTRT